MDVISDALIPAVVFFAIYHTVKIISEYLLKRRLIKEGQYDKPGILEPVKSTSEEANKYPSLKWGLVAFATGLGFIVIEITRQINPTLIDYNNAVLPVGILLVFVSLGFLTYFFIMNSKKKS